MADLIEGPDLLQTLRDLSMQPGEEVPKGWKTAKEYAKEWNVCYSTARTLLHNGAENGVMEAQSFRIRMGNIIRRVQHYRPKDKKAR
jgi:hypothetical protein